MIVRFQTIDVPFQPHPLPIPDPTNELFDVIFPFMIVRFQTIDVPFRPNPLPIPDPCDELLDVIFPFMIVRFQTLEVPFQLHPAPIPDPYDAPFCMAESLRSRKSFFFHRLLAMIVPFNIVRLKTVELCGALPIPDPPRMPLARIHPS
jgi:hypothetical protein